jgi:hypothetical protein
MKRPRTVSILAGCGSTGGSPDGGSKAVRTPGTAIVAPGKHRFSPGELRPGDPVRCRGGVAGAAVPGPGHGVSGTADGVTESSSITIENRGDVVIVTCDVS